MCLVVEPGGEVFLIPSETLTHLMTHPGKERRGRERLCEEASYTHREYRKELSVTV